MSDQVTFYENAAFLSSGLDDRVKYFLCSVFRKFNTELNSLVKSLYSNDPKKIFDGIEATWVGIFNNAIIKEFKEEVSTMQEYSVKIDEHRYGRADYFVRYKNEYDLLFEAKIDPETGVEYKKEKMEDWYDKILNQAFTYYENNTEDYSKETFVIAIVFGWVRTEKALEKVKKQFNSFKANPIDSTDFWALYHHTDSGISVYGKVKNVREFKT